MLDWEQFIVNVLTSSAVGVIANKLFSEWQKRKDYKRDYYKKIIDKRMNAYENMAKVLGNIGTKAVYHVNGKDKEIYVCFDSYKSLDRANTEMMSVLNDIQWISPETYKNLYQLNNIIATVADEAYHSSRSGKEWDMNDYRKAGVEKFESVKKLLVSVNNKRFNDISNLDDVEKFFKEQKAQLKH